VYITRRCSLYVRDKGRRYDMTHVMLNVFVTKCVILPRS
jgi:hypothetical protein